MPVELTDQEIEDAHKRAHGLTPESDLWDDERWSGEWGINVEAFRSMMENCE
jgi:hypothetical protein